MTGLVLLECLKLVRALPNLVTLAHFSHFSSLRVQNNLKKFALADVYYCEKKVRNVRLSQKNLLFGASESVERVPGRNDSDAALSAGLSRSF
jgi:hypothetical protein